MHTENLLIIAILVSIIILFIVLYYWLISVFRPTYIENRIQQNNQETALLQDISQNTDMPCVKGCSAGVCLNPANCSNRHCLKNNCCCADEQCENCTDISIFGADYYTLTEKFADVSMIPPVERSLENVEYEVRVKDKNNIPVYDVSFQSPNITIEKRNVVGAPDANRVRMENEKILETNQDILALNKRIKKHNSQIHKDNHCNDMGLDDDIYYTQQEILQ